jgi:hypothetical protein
MFRGWLCCVSFSHSFPATFNPHTVSDIDAVRTHPFAWSTSKLCDFSRVLLPFSIAAGIYFSPFPVFRGYSLCCACYIQPASARTLIIDSFQTRNMHDIVYTRVKKKLTWSRPRQSSRIFLTVRTVCLQAVLTQASVTKVHNGTKMSLDPYKFSIHKLLIGIWHAHWPWFHFLHINFWG